MFIDDFTRRNPKREQDIWRSKDSQEEPMPIGFEEKPVYIQDLDEVRFSFYKDSFDVCKILNAFVLEK